MKYMLSWRERPMGSARDYEGAQERIMTIFQNWEMPASLTILQFVMRVGGHNGYMLVETDAPADLHFVGCVFAAFEFTIEPVLDIGEAAPAEMRAIEYRRTNAA